MKALDWSVVASNPLLHLIWNRIYGYQKKQKYPEFLLMCDGNTNIFRQAAIFPLANGRLKSRMPLSTLMHYLSHDIDEISSED